MPELRRKGQGWGAFRPESSRCPLPRALDSGGGAPWRSGGGERRRALAPISYSGQTLVTSAGSFLRIEKTESE